MVNIQFVVGRGELQHDDPQHVLRNMVQLVS
jgi:hypothetical protein